MLSPLGRSSKPTSRNLSQTRILTGVTPRYRTRPPLSFCQARNTYTTIDNPQGSSNTDDIYAQPFKTKKDAESARATRQVFAAPVAAPVAPPLPPRVR